jgi:POT family proton-dependent oligopeptide transporter
MVKVMFVDLGEAAADTRALGIYGSYTSMVYLFPVIGGLIADRIFGFRKAVIFGGIFMMLGQFALALVGIAFDNSLLLFFGALALIIVGNGFFKPNISSFLGKFYDPNDPRKDGAFTIFYMGINIGAFLSTLTCGYVGENISWSYGFGLAGIGMGLGVLVFRIWGQRFFGDKGLEPDPEKARKPILGTPKPEFPGGARLPDLCPYLCASAEPG